MNYNIFNSEPTTEQAADYAEYMAALPTSKTIQDEDGGDVIINIDNGVYCSGTSAWATPYQRATDQKWVYPVCPAGSQSHTQEPFDPSWIPGEP